MSQRVINILSVVVLLIMLILFIGKYLQTETPYNRIELSTNNIIKNESQFSFVDTTLSVALDVAEVRGVYVLVRDLTSDIRQRFSEQNQGVDLQATIIGRGNQYILYVYKLDRIDALKTISHEVIHLMQYHSGRLQIISPTQIIWQNDTLSDTDLYNIRYISRPWEIEAFDNEATLQKKIEKILY